MEDNKNLNSINVLADELTAIEQTNDNESCVVNDQPENESLLAKDKSEDVSRDNSKDESEDDNIVNVINKIDNLQAEATEIINNKKFIRLNNIVDLDPFVLFTNCFNAFSDIFEVLPEIDLFSKIVLKEAGDYKILLNITIDPSSDMKPVVEFSKNGALLHRAMFEKNYFEKVFPFAVNDQLEIKVVGGTLVFNETNKVMIVKE